MADKQEKCAHAACTCIAPEGQKYCSQFCQDSIGTTTLQCDCGHPGCERQAL